MDHILNFHTYHVLDLILFIPFNQHSIFKTYLCACMSSVLLTSHSILPRVSSIWHSSILQWQTHTQIPSNSPPLRTILNWPSFSMPAFDTMWEPLGVGPWHWECWVKGCFSLTFQCSRTGVLVGRRNRSYMYSYGEFCKLPLGHWYAWDLGGEINVQTYKISFSFAEVKTFITSL